MPRGPASLRHLTAHRLAFATVALTVVFTVACAAAAASFAAAVAGASVRRSLGSAAGSTILVSAQTSAAGAARAGAIVTSALRRAAAGLPMAVTASAQSPYLNLPASGPGGSQVLAQVISLPGLERHATRLSGSWPAGNPRGPVPVCIPARPARALRLAAGGTATLRATATGAAVTVRVSCTFRRDQPTSAYWSLSPLGSGGIQHAAGSTSYGPLVTSGAVLAAGRVPVGSASWLADPDFRRLAAPDLARLSDRLSAASSGLANSAALGGATVTTRLPALLASLATSLVVARSQLLIGVLILLLIAGATVTVTVRLLAAAREAEIALLAARGASRRQLAGRGLADALLLGIPAAVAGPFIGGGLAELVTRSGPLAGYGPRLGPDQPAAAWLASAAVAAGCAVIVLLPWLRPPPSPLRRRVLRGRQRATGALAAAGADIALVAVAGAAGWQLANLPAPATTGIDGQLGVDPVLAGAPVLVLAAGALVTLRLLPLAARLGDRAAARSRGVATAVAAWQISRRPLRQAGPALLAVLAVAIAVVALAEDSSWHRSVQDQARFAVGADTRITLPAAATLPLGQVAAITAASGVRVATPAVRVPFAVPQGTSATLLALDPRAAAAVVALRAGAGGSSLPRLLAALAPAGPPPGTPVPGRPARLRVTARLAGRGIAAPVLLLQLTDAAGMGYQVAAGSLPADGRPHLLTATIAARHRADYPLRLTGFTLQYLQAGQPPAAASLDIESVRAAAGTRGGFGTPFPAAAPRQRLLTAAGAGAGPAAAVARAAGRTVAVTFRTGGGAGGGPVAATLSVTTGPTIGALPALVTSSFLAASGERLGRTVRVEVEGTAIPVLLTRQVSRFATVAGPAGGLVVDQAALQDALRQRGLAPAPATEWWLRTSRAPVLSGLPPGTSVASRAALARSLARQPLSAAPVQALVAIAVAAVLLACGGFVVSVAAGRERQRDVAMLDALGARPGQVLRLLCLEQTIAAVPAAAAGLLLGVLVSRLIVPAVTLTAQAARPDPPVLVLVPWPLAAGIAAIIAGVPAIAAALAATRLAATATTLRAQEET